MPKLHRIVPIYVRGEDAWLVETLRASLAPGQSLSMLTVQNWRAIWDELQARSVQAQANPKEPQQ